MTRLIPIVEIFGPVIQGEGAMAGLPTIFVRTGGCDYRCAWCDTLYAVDVQKHGKNWRRLDAPAVVAEVLGLVDDERPWITLSGGNPAMWPLDDLVAGLHAAGFRVAIETQGTLLPAWLAQLDAVTFSPKPPSSDHDPDIRHLATWCIENPTVPTSIKVVIADDADLTWFAGVRRRMLLAGAGRRFYVQPCNPDPDIESPDRLDLLDRYEALCRAVIAWGWSDVAVLPQLHVLANGGGRGK